MGARSSGLSPGKYGMPKPPPRLSDRTGEGAASGKSQGELEGLGLRFADRLGAQVLGAAEDMKPLEVQSGLVYLSERLRHLLGIDAELLRPTAHLHARRFEFEIRIHADCDSRRTSLAPRDLGQQVGSRETIRR